MSNHLQHLTAIAGPIVAQAVTSQAFDEALQTRCRSAALARVAGGADDPLEIGRAAAESPDAGVAMSDALLDDLDPADRQQLEEEARATLAWRVQVAALAYVAGRLEATLDPSATFDDVDVATIVHVGIGLTAVVE